MSDARRAALARTIIHHSTRLAPDEAILIDAYDVADGLVNDLVDAGYAVGGLPLETRWSPEPCARTSRRAVERLRTAQPGRDTLAVAHGFNY